jgi:hypothetical protein
MRLPTAVAAKRPDVFIDDAKLGDCISIFYILKFNLAKAVVSLICNRGSGVGVIFVSCLNS